MFILDSTAKSITAVMSGAAATTNPNFTAAYADNNGSTFVEGANDGTLNGTSAVTLVAAPASSTRRIVKTITIENTDTAAVTVTVGYLNTASTRTIVKVTLQVGDAWTTDGTYDSSGNLKQVLGNVNLATQVFGTLPVANGGSGATTLTGVLKGNGTSAFTAATAGTDYVAPGTATTFTATQTFSGSSSVKAMKTSNIAEVDTISATAATGTINYDVTTQSVLYYTTSASGNWTVNFRGSSGTSLDTLMATGESISATFLVTQGATAYYNSAVTIDGSAVTPKWQGGTAPSSGNASSVDCYTYVIQKTGSATFAVLASQTKFA